MKHIEAAARIACIVISAVLFAAVASAQETRIASDFEIQQMEKQAANARSFLAQLSAHLNLGDLRATRNESATARAEYQKAFDIAVRERTDGRKAGDLSRYAAATMYEGLAAAKLGRGEEAFAFLQEAARYSSDSAQLWNTYASVMNILGQPQKAVSGSRNAVTIAAAEAKKSPTSGNALDLAVYQYSLALALAQTGAADEAIATLQSVIDSLKATQFDPLRKEIARVESFQIYSFARGEGPAYISLLNRAQLQLASLYEKRGDITRARNAYQDVLAARSDDPIALAALARLAPSDEERARSFVDAFDANPFSIELIRDYQRWLASSKPRTANEETTTGARVRKAIEDMGRGENRAAGATLDALMAKFPDNDVLQYLAALNDIALGDTSRARSRKIGNSQLRSEVGTRIAATAAPVPEFLTSKSATATPSADELRETMALFVQQRITPEQRVRLDAITFTSMATFTASAAAAQAGQTVFENGTIDGVPFRFSEPTAFTGAFAAQTPLRLTYRILGVTDVNGTDALLLEPLKLGAAR